MCIPCSSINSYCTTCTYDSTNFEGDCSTCSTGTLSADKRDCTVAGCTTINNCATVNSSDCTICDACASGFRWNATTKTCQLCNTIDSACTACTHNSVCTTCSGGKIPQVGGGSCVTPAANCFVYLPSDYSKCFQCQDLYVAANNICVACNQIPSCTACVYNSSSPLQISCTTCGVQCVIDPSGQTINTPQVVNPGGQSCVVQADHCTTLNATDYSKCQTCNANYALHSVTKQCIACSSITSCTACTYNGSSSLNISCSTCSGGMIPNVNGQSCVNSPSNCQVVDPTDYSKCSTCNTGYGLHSTTKQCLSCSVIGSCTACVYNASSALSLSCSSCSGGLVPSTNKQSCVNGSPNCNVFDPSDITLCQTCNTGFTLNTVTKLCLDCSTISSCTSCVYNGSSAVDLSCSACSGGMIPQADRQTCVVASQNCQVLKPTDFELCSTCDAGFGLLLLTELCVDCSAQITNCIDCHDDMTQFVCDQCSSSLMPTADGLTCVAEILNCASLDVDPSKCAQCNQGYGYSSDQTVCDTCALVSGVTGCALCTSTISPTYQVTCDSCGQGQVLSGSACINICEQVDTQDSSKCQKCISSPVQYYVDVDGTCVTSCKSYDTSNTKCEEESTDSTDDEPCELSHGLCTS